MALAVLPRLRNPASAFVQYLIKRGNLKSGFATVLAGRDFPEIDRYLVDQHLFTSESLAESYAGFYGLPFARLYSLPILPSVISLLPEDVARKYAVVPFKLEGLNLHLAVGEPSRLQWNAPSVLTMLHRQKGLQVQLTIVPKADVEAVLSKVHQKNPAQGSLINQPTLSVNIPTDSAPVSASPPNPVEVKSLNKEDLIKEVEPRQKTIDLTSIKIAPEILNKIPFDVAKRYQIVAFGQESPKSQFEPPLIKIALVHPDDPKTKEIVNFIESRNKVLVDRFQTTAESLDYVLKLYPEAERTAPKAGTTAEQVEKTFGGNEQTPAKAVTPPVVSTVPPPPNITPTPKTENEPHVQTELDKANNKSYGVNSNSAPAAANQPASKPTSTSGSAKPDAPKDPTKLVQAVQGVTEGMTLSSSDIINKPTLGDTTEELQRLANEQENSLEGQNLDRLLTKPVTSIEDLAKVFQKGVIPEIVAATLFLAIQMKASDVHIEALMDSARLRFRIDGILHDIISVPAFLHAPLTSRIKILSKMKIDEQRIPQDGRFDVIIDKHQVDLRVSTLPTVHGEKVVMRLLDKSTAVLTLEQLGVTGTNFDNLIANVNKPYGIIMSTGPTGSGKSTTLYAILIRISKPGVNIITLEDPVEYELPGVNQSQVKPQIGFTFAEGLRSVLRQDPNIIMVGEIRDLETAAMATHAALTGHLVLTTLHTNDAAGALPRLINMGVEPFLITSSLNAVVGQRLVRKICENCREKVTIPRLLLEKIRTELAALPSGQMKNINLDQLVFYHGKGCPECNDGYTGRIGIFEVLPMSSQVEELAIRKAPSSEIKKAAIAAGMITMTQDGLLKALKGITTVDEMMRVTTTHTSEIPGMEPKS